LLLAEQRLLATIKELWPVIWQAARYIYENPELGGQEFKAVNYLTTLLKEYNFEVNERYLGLPTAFKAQFGSGKPAIYFLAEYDALPQIGHGCGHHLIAGASLGAALALAKIKERWSGQIVVLGTPAEETQGAKVELAKKGAFQECSAALMFHPGQSAVINITSQALEAIEVIYQGDFAHSAGKTGLGNPLLSLVNFYQQVIEYNKKYSPLYQIQGIISEGGRTPNLVPQRAVGRFYLRSLKEKDLEDLVGKFKEMAKEAAHQNNTKVRFNNFEPRYLPMLTNSKLANIFIEASRDLGLSMDTRNYQIMGSLDMGNVSWQVPAIHPYLPLNGGSVVAHTPQFAKKAGGKDGEKTMFLATSGLALTAFRLFTHRGYLESIWNEYRKRVKYK
jgi:amidohydrolase